MAMRALLRNAGLVVLSTALALGLAELMVRAFVSVRDVGPVFSLHDPVLGKRIRADFSAERITPEFRMRFTTNSLGFRGPEPQRSAVRPILFLGDSFTLGYGVSDGEEYPALVAAELRRRQGEAAPPVLNAGIGNSGNGFWLKLLRRDGASMQPAVVVMQVFENDFDDNLGEQLYRLEPGGNLQELPVPGPGMMRRIEAVIQNIPGLSYSRLIGLLREVRLPALGARPPAGPAPSEPKELAPGDALTLRIVEEAMALCEGRGWKVVGLLVGLSPAREAAVKALFDKRNLRAVLVPSKQERPDLYYRVDGHWHAAGHRFVAERLLAALPGG